MKVALLGSSTGSSADRSQYLMSMLVNDTMAIDAGCIGFLSPVRVQSLIQHIFISHSHLDHLVSLPVLLDNVYAPNRLCPTVYGSESVLEVLREHFLNDAIWPDLFRIATTESAFLETHQLQAGKPVEAEGLRITPVELNHSVPTMGFLIEEHSASIAFVSDTGPTREIWDHVNDTPNLKAVFLETAFPSSMQAVADRAAHLTPATLQTELRKLERDVPVIVVHVKAAFRREVEQQINALGKSRIQIGVPGSLYEF